MIIHVPSFLAIGTQRRNSCNPVVGVRWRWQGAQKQEAGCPGGRSWHITHSHLLTRPERALTGAHLRTWSCCSSLFQLLLLQDLSPPPLFPLVSGIYRSFPAHPWGWLSSGPRLFWLSLKYQSPRCFPERFFSNVLLPDKGRMGRKTRRISRVSGRFEIFLRKGE